MYMYTYNVLVLDAEKKEKQPAQNKMVITVSQLVLFGRK